MVVEEETPDRAGPQTRMEGLLGVSEGYDAAFLPLRLSRRAISRGGTEAPHHCRRSHHAAHSRTPQTRPRVLPQHSFRRRLPLPGTPPEKYVFLPIIFRSSTDILHVDLCRVIPAPHTVDQYTPKSALEEVEVVSLLTSFEDRTVSNIRHMWYRFRIFSCIISKSTRCTLSHPSTGEDDYSKRETVLLRSDTYSISVSLCHGENILDFTLKPRRFSY